VLRGASNDLRARWLCTAENKPGYHFHRSYDWNDRPTSGCMVSFELADDKQSGSRTISAAFTRLARRVTRPALYGWIQTRNSEFFSPFERALSRRLLAVNAKAVDRSALIHCLGRFVGRLTSDNLENSCFETFVRDRSYTIVVSGYWTQRLNPAAHAQDITQKLAGFDEFMERALKDWNAPGSEWASSSVTNSSLRRVTAIAIIKRSCR